MNYQSRQVFRYVRWLTISLLLARYLTGRFESIHGCGRVEVEDTALGVKELFGRAILVIANTLRVHALTLFSLFKY